MTSYFDFLRRDRRQCDPSGVVAESRASRPRPADPSGKLERDTHRAGDCLRSHRLMLRTDIAIELAGHRFTRERHGGQLINAVHGPIVLRDACAGHFAVLPGATALKIVISLVPTPKSPSRRTTRCGGRGRDAGATVCLLRETYPSSPRSSRRPTDHDCRRWLGSEPHLLPGGSRKQEQGNVYRSCLGRRSDGRF